MTPQQHPLGGLDPLLVVVVLVAVLLALIGVGIALDRRARRRRHRDTQPGRRRSNWQPTVENHQPAPAGETRRPRRNTTSS